MLFKNLQKVENKKCKNTPGKYEPKESWESNLNIWKKNVNIRILSVYINILVNIHILYVYINMLVNIYILHAYV